MKNFKVGDIIKLNRSFLGETVGTLAYVYDEYVLDTPGVSIITENGVDLGGFNSDGEYDYLDYVITSSYQYEFKNVIQLNWDFNSLIEPIFKEIKNKTLC